MSACEKIMSTDDSSIFSKASCARHGYWEDDALLKLIPNSPKGLFLNDIQNKNVTN